MSDRPGPRPLTFRTPAEEELEAFMLPVWRNFGEFGPDAARVEHERVQWERARAIGALDGDEWVAGAGIFTMDLTLPGGAALPAAGVTMVGVAPTHRRRGILNEFMRRQLDAVAAGPEPVAVLTASEAGIYGRYGYGLATRGLRLRLASAHAALRPDAPAPPAGGRLRQVTLGEASALLPEAYERVRRRRPGSVARTDVWWRTHVFADRPQDRDGRSALAVVVHAGADGAVDGWATYRVAHRWDDRLPDGSVVVEDLMAVDDAVHLDLWRVLLAHDLMSEVDVLHAPLDDPIRWALADPRRLRGSEVTDWLWVRLVDVPATLGARRWGAAGRLVIDVVDAFRPASGGRFAIDADATGAGTVARTDAPAELTLAAEELATIVLGGVEASTLARVGRIREDRPGALAVADALFRSEVAPHCATMF